MSLKHTPIPLAIVGGGAAGLFAAAAATGRKLPVLLFERKARLGSKLLMTANGRCNFTRDIPPEEMARDLGDPVGPWAAKALGECPPSFIAKVFGDLGVKIRRTDDGRLFPASDEATAIVHAFGDLLRDEGVPICTNCPVTGIQPVKNGFIVAAGAFTVWAEKVLVATGGLSFPKTGSVGDGLRMARETGHDVEPCRPGLVGYETEDPSILRLAGERFVDSWAKVLDEAGETLFEARGEVECETWGVGGAAVYNCSRFVARNPPPGEWSLEVGLGDSAASLPSPAPRPLKEAIVTVGGVSLADVDPETMESRKVPGLYFAGEVLDIDGPTGGYNLTLAFATARLAVESACAARAMPRPSTQDGGASAASAEGGENGGGEAGDARARAGESQSGENADGEDADGEDARPRTRRRPDRPRRDDGDGGWHRRRDNRDRPDFRGARDHRDARDDDGRPWRSHRPDFRDHGGEEDRPWYRHRPDFGDVRDRRGAPGDGDRPYRRQRPDFRDDGDEGGRPWRRRGDFDAARDGRGNGEERPRRPYRPDGREEGDRPYRRQHPDFRGDGRPEGGRGPFPGKGGFHKGGFKKGKGGFHKGKGGFGKGRG